MARYNNDRITNLANALGLEDDDYVESAGEEISDAELVEAGNEVDEGVDEVETSLDTAEDLADDNETLTNVGEVVDGAIESGEGLSEDAATVVEETIENILRRHGMKRHLRFSYPSMENFDSKAGRIRAAKQLKVSIESFIDTITQGIKALIENLKVSFQRLFGSFSNWEEGVAKACDQLVDRYNAGGKKFATYQEIVRSGDDLVAAEGGSAGRVEKPSFMKHVFMLGETHETEVKLSNISELFNKFISEVKDKMPLIEKGISKYDNPKVDTDEKGAVNNVKTDAWTENDPYNKLAADYLFASGLSKSAPHQLKTDDHVELFNVDQCTEADWTGLVYNIRREARVHHLKKLEKYSLNGLQKFFAWIKEKIAAIKNVFKMANANAGSDIKTSAAASSDPNAGQTELKSLNQATKEQCGMFRKVMSKNVQIYKESFDTAFQAARLVMDRRMMRGDVVKGQKTVK